MYVPLFLYFFNPSLHLSLMSNLNSNLLPLHHPTSFSNHKLLCISPLFLLCISLSLRLFSLTHTCLQLGLGQSGSHSSMQADNRTPEGRGPCVTPPCLWIGLLVWHLDQPSASYFCLQSLLHIPATLRVLEGSLIKL